MFNLPKYWLFFIGFGLFSICSYSQKDTSRVKSNTIKLENEVNLTRSIKGLKSSSANKKVSPKSNFDFNINKKLNKNAVAKTANKYKQPENKSHILMENRPEDRDIIGVKFWEGKDVTHRKLQSNFSLGTVKSTTKRVRVECRDHSLVDGDRIKIYLNEKVISTNIGLKSNYYVVYLDLEKGYNRIDFQALNQGYSGPNTAEVNLYDDKGNLISAKEWNITTGETATLGVIKN